MLAVLAGLASVGLFMQDRRARASAQRFVRSFGLDRRCPEEVEAMALEPAGDLAAAMAVNASVSKRAEGFPGEWRSAVDRPSGGKGPPPEELRAARELMLDAVAFRPGWAPHWRLLGLVDFREARRTGGGARRGGRWGATLSKAVAAAPGMDAAWIALGEADLAAWDELSPAARARAPIVFRRCFSSEAFVTAHFRDVVVALGRSPAGALLPDDADALEPAARMLAEDGDVDGTARLLSRMERAERRERAADLRSLEKCLRLGDIKGLRLGCMSWFDRHPFAEFDDPVGRSEAARLLELWPGDRPGSWTRDRRGKLVRFFLDGRESDANGRALRKAVESLSGVPESVRSRVLLLSGDAFGARALARAARASDPLDWDPFFLALARQELSRQRLLEARAALEKLSFGGQEGCDALLLGRQIARRLGEKEQLESIAARLQPLREASSEDWAARGALSVCVDPDSGAAQSLEVRVGPGPTAILAFGWNGGRSGTIPLPAGEGSFRVPLAGLSGQRTLWASFLVGGTGRSLHASSGCFPKPKT